MALKMNSSLRFPENRRLKTKIDSFLIDPLTCVDVRRQASDFALIGRQCSPGLCSLARLTLFYERFILYVFRDEFSPGLFGAISFNVSI